MLVNMPRLQAKMDAEGLEGLVATTLPNILYLTGIENVTLDTFRYSAQAYAVITRDQPGSPYYVASVDGLSQTLNAEVSLKGTVGFGTFHRDIREGVELTPDEQFLWDASAPETWADGPLDGLLRALDALGLAEKRVGVDEVGLLPGVFEALSSQAKGPILPASKVFQSVRMVKSAAEIRRIRQAARMTEIALTAVKGIIRPGVSEIEIVREFERAVVSQGGKPKATLVRVGRNGAMSNARPGNRRMAWGDCVRFDLASTRDGYWADIARVFCLGEPDPRMQTLYGAMLAGEDAAIEWARPGMTAGELFEMTVEAVRAAGAPGYRRHHLGHGIGAEVYDPPLIGPGVDIELEEGMVINVETPYYEFNFGSAHIEDPFVVGANGNTLLTGLSRELHIIE